MIPLGRWILRAAAGKDLIPLPQVRFYRKISVGTDSLFPRRVRKNSGGELENLFLANKLKNTELGIWSMSSQALNFLESEIHRNKPATILEFGSGVSTACIARYMHDLHGTASRIHVYSFEQDENSVESTRTLLEITGTSQYVRLIHSPVRRQVIENAETICYAPPERDVLEQIKSCPPDFIVIDGPSGESGIRFGTLPLAHSMSKDGARFYLDDALRDSELETAERWNHLPYVRIEGLLPTEKGMLIGTISPNTSI